jgi:iron complex outermembrane recepter protein
VKDRVSVFGSYMSGFQNTAPINQPDGNLLVLKPIYANQSEGGIKAELLNHQLNLNLSYYYIAIDNATRTDENRFTIQDAKQVSKGIELEVTAHPTSGLSIVAGYAYNDNRIIRTTDRTVEGNKAAGAPENVANFWLSYSLQQSALKGLGLGFGGNFVDKAYFATTNTYYLPAYSTLNGTLFYGRSNWRMALKVNNLGNRKYWDLWGAPQATRNVAANLTFRF